MAATVRGGTSSPAKPRSQAAGPARGGGGGKSAPSKSQSAKSQSAKVWSPKSGGKPPTYVPGKLAAAHGLGLPPRLALGIAAGAIALALVGAMAAEHRAQHIGGGVVAAIDGAMARFGFKVSSLSVQGASAMAQPDIVKAAGVYKNDPILGVDLAALRARIEQVGWVKTARVERLLPDAIVIDVVQRATLAVWQHGGRTEVIDADGHPIPEADPGRFPDLPLVVGEGANDNAAAILPLVRSRPRLMQRLDALVRVDDRRWDLRMSDGALIQLPAVAPDSALIQLDQLDQKSRILELGFARIDLRDPELVAVRPKDAAPPGQLVAGGA